MMILSGCGSGLVAPLEDLSRQSLTLSALGVDDDHTYIEKQPNDRFELAEFVAAGTEPQAIRGRINSQDDVDVYNLGRVSAGERIVVAMAAAATLDEAIAAFDDSGAALLVNDHRNVYLGRTDPFIDLIVQRPSESFFVAVSATPGFSTVGDYALVVQRVFPVDPPRPRPDVVLLVFNGGHDVRIGGRPSIDVPAFDAASISPAFAGQTEAMVREIVARVREDFLGYDVMVLATNEGTWFQPGMTRVYFGTYDEALLGVAEGVDEFNATSGQQAIVFTDTFSAFTRLAPSVEEMAQAIANVASHEIGHLLGMVHTADPAEIMDVTASLAELLADQTFTRSPLYSGVFPLGDQDAVQYLTDAVGVDPSVQPPAEGTIGAKWVSGPALQRRSATARENKGARESLRLSTCCLAAETESGHTDQGPH